MALFGNKCADNFSVRQGSSALAPESKSRPVFFFLFLLCNVVLLPSTVFIHFMPKWWTSSTEDHLNLYPALVFFYTR